MVGLLDIAVYRKKVPVSGTEVEVRGISARRITALLERFPELRKMFADRAIRADELMKMGPEIICAIIAEATIDKVGGESEKERHKRLAEIEEQAQELSLGDQLELVSEIVVVTFPQGLQALVGRLEQLGLTAARSAGTGKGSATRLPPEFNGAFKSEDTPQSQSGNTPPESLPPGTN